MFVKELKLENNLKDPEKSYLVEVFFLRSSLKLRLNDFNIIVDIMKHKKRVW